MDQPDRYYIHVADEWGLDRPLGVIRVLDGGPQEQIGPGAVWTPGEGALERATRAPGHRAIPVDSEAAERAAARWAYEYRRIAERETGRTVAWVRFWTPPSMSIGRVEESTCRSGIWEPTQRLSRIDLGKDDYDVETVDAVPVETELPEHRYFAVVHDRWADHGLNHPAEILRVRTGQENGARERLGDGWEPYDMIDGVDGLRKLTLLEVDDEAIARFRARGPHPEPPPYTYFALLHGGAESIAKPSHIVRQSRTHEEELRPGPRWATANLSGRGTRDTDPLAIEIPAQTAESLTDRWRYTYYEILPKGQSEPIAVVRQCAASGGREEAAVGWPVWSPSQWLKQIGAGKVACRAEQADPAAVERFLRQAAADQYRYFAILEEEESIESPWSMVRAHCREDGEPWKEETPLKDGNWRQSYALLEIRSGRGSWWREAVEVPQWMFDAYRARRSSSHG